MEIAPEIFHKFCSIAYDKAGISLKSGKEALVAARVSKRMRVLQLNSYKEYLVILENDETGVELVNFLDAISTNYTKFFREMDHFEYLKGHLEKWVALGRKRLRFWSAACSSGEEAYSMAITIAEAVDGHNIDCRILATDISTKVLRKAVEGIYDSTAVQSLPRALRAKYFDRLGKRNDENCRYRVKPDLKKKIVFRRLNLTHVPFPMTGPLDVVFCRNVMIYFDTKVRKSLIENIQTLLKPGGLFMIGHTETLTGIRHEFETVKPSIYKISGIAN